MQTLVIGLGKSGRAASEWLLSLGKSVIGVDRNRENLYPARSKPSFLVQHEEEPIDWDLIELCVVSPGISPLHPLYAQAISRGIVVKGEAELALTHFKIPVLAVTGTNGKTSVTLLLTQALSCAGIKAEALGNVGTPLCSYLLNPHSQAEVAVVELSSFQLETINSPVLDAAVILNITPDHLDRYENMQGYARAKCRLQQCLKPGGSLFVHHDVVTHYGPLLKSGYSSYGAHLGVDLYTDKKCVKKGDGVECFFPPEYEMKGLHESENALAAWALYSTQSRDRDSFSKALSSYQKPPHRIEYVTTIKGVTYYDDSKGTNIDAVVHAVKSVGGPVILIAGGVDKGASYLIWKELLWRDVKKIIAIGAAAGKIYTELHPFFNICIAESLETAVEMAAECADVGDRVMLSPGCSSYDQFRDYAHRGEEFKRFVSQLRRNS